MRKFLSILIAASLLLTTHSCVEDANPPLFSSTLESNEVLPDHHSVTVTDCLQVTNDIGNATLECSVDLSFSDYKSYNSSHTCSNGVVTLKTTIDGLEPGTKYYYRYLLGSQCDNMNGADQKVYTSTMSFTTKAYGAPIVQTEQASDLTFSSAVISASKVSNNADCNPDTWGICFASHSDPDINDKFYSANPVSNNLSVTVDDLSAGTYYFRAFASNKYGTSYGDIVQFTIISRSALNVQTLQALEIGSNFAIVNAAIYCSEEKIEIIEKGILYSRTNSNPSENDIKVTCDIPGLGSYDCYLNGLTPNTKYYYKAYAKCQYGTVYGNVQSLTTK